MSSQKPRIGRTPVKRASEMSRDELKNAALKAIHAKTRTNELTGCMVIPRNVPADRAVSMQFAGERYSAGAMACLAKNGRVTRDGYVMYRVVGCKSASCCNPEHRVERVRGSHCAEIWRDGRVNRDRHRRAVALGGRAISKVTPEIRAEIIGSDERKEDVAARYGIHPETVRRIRKSARLAPTVGALSIVRWAL